MHWTGQYASCGRHGRVSQCRSRPDFQAAGKQAHAGAHQSLSTRLAKVFILSRRELTISEPEYWVKIKGEQVYRYELTGLTLPENWQDWAKNKLCDNDGATPQWQEYQDPGLGNYRAARIVNNRLESVVFIAAGSELPATAWMQEVEQRREQLPERNWLSGLFAKTQLDKAERMALLTAAAHR